MGDQLKIPLIDDMHAPDVFSTDASGFIVLGGNVSITFEAMRCDHSSEPGPVNRVVVGRLVMPVQGAQRLVLGLYDFLKLHGADPFEALKQGSTPQ